MTRKLDVSLLLLASACALTACSTRDDGVDRPADAGLDTTRSHDGATLDVSSGSDAPIDGSASDASTIDAGVGGDARDGLADVNVDIDVALDRASDVGTDAPFDTGGDGATPGPKDVNHVCATGLALRVTVLDDRAVRVHYVQNGAPQAERGWFVDTSKFAGPTSIVVDDSAAKLSIATAALVVEASGATCSLAIRDRSGTVLWQESAPYRADNAGAPFFGKKLDDGEHIYGLGEKTGGSDRRGRSFEMWNSDPAWTDAMGQYRTVSDPIYQSHPFFLSMRKGGRATGAFWANTNHTFFDVGKTATDALSMSASAGDVDLFFFDGPAPAEVLERYTRLVGRPFLPPLWTLGYHQSRWSYTPASRVEDIAAEFRQRSLPADGLWLDIDYMDGFRDFTWNASTFPDPAGLASRLAARGFKLTAILDPGIKSDPGGQYAPYNAGIADHRFIMGTDQTPVIRECWPGSAAFPDFTSDGTRKWWGDLVGAFQASGLRGIWIDMNEPAVFTKDGFALDAHVDGEGTATTFAEVKNVYALLMARATYEGSLRAFPNRRPFTLTRAGFAGVQRYAAVWTGDAQSTWDHLAMTPSMLAGMSVSGMAFIGSDVGGFGGSPAPELYGRWFELGSLSPFFRSHVSTGAPDQEPWSFGPEVESVARRMLEQRYALLPYWYGAYVAATRTGAPLLRPLWFEFPSDDQATLHDDELFIGPSLLAAPITAANVTARDVYLPAGTFYDYHTGARYDGPVTVNMPAALGQVPLFVRAGAIVPTQDVVDFVGAPSNGKKYLDVFPGTVGSSSSVDFYEDDGETNAYAQGAFATTTASSSVTATALNVNLAAPVGSFVTATTALVVRVHGVASAPSEVSVDGTAVSVAYDVGTRVVTVPALTPGAAHTIVINYGTATPAAPRQVNVDFTLAIPASTPAGDIYVAASALAWKPDGLKLTRSGNTATGRLTVLEGTLIKWKATRGAWASVEVDATCANLSNREIVADYGSTGTTAVQLTVASWVDHCP